MNKLAFMTPDLIIDKLGGTSELATALSVDPPVVSNWRERGIPPRRWPEIVAVAESRGVKGITFEALALVVTGKAAGEVVR